MKLFERVLEKRLRKRLEDNGFFSKYQSGFRKSKSTNDHLFRLSQTIMESFNRGEHVIAAFLDVEKAFDNVWQNGLRYKIYQLDLPTNSGDLRQGLSISLYISKRNATLFSELIISAISDRQTKIRDQILTKSIRLQYRDFRTVFSVFRLIYTYCSLNSILKRQKNSEDIESQWLFLLNNTGNEWCCLIFSAKFREKDRQLYKKRQ